MSRSLNVVVVVAGALVAASCGSGSTTETGCVPACGAKERCDTATRLCVSDELPLVTLNALPAVVTQAMVTVSGKASDDDGISTVEYSLDGTTFTAATLTGDTFTATVAVPQLDAQMVTVTIRAKDKAGQQAEVKGTTVVDRVGPVLMLTAPTATVGGASAMLVGTATDGTHMIRDMTVRIGSVTKPVTVTTEAWSVSVPLPAGKDVEDVEVVMTAKDANDNATESTTMVRVDTTGPVLSLTSPMATVGGTSAQLVGGANDKSGAVASVKVTVYGADTTVSVSNGVFQHTVSFAAGQDGVTIPVKFTAQDQFGNEAMFDTSVRVDNKGPTIGLVGTGTVGLAGQLRGTVTDGTPPVSAVTVKQAGVTVATAVVDGGSWVAQLAFDAGLNGTSIPIEASASDSLGNMGTSSLSMTVDTQPPVTTFTSPAAAAVLSGTSVTITGQEADFAPISSVELDFDDGQGYRAVTCTGTAGCSWSITVPLSSQDGTTHTVSVRATDEGGNQSTATRVFVVDNVAPVIQINTPDAGISYRASAVIAVSTTVTEGTGVPKSVEALFESQTKTMTRVGATSTYTTTVNVNNSGDYVPENITVRATDNANNVATKVVGVRIDTVQPVVTFTTKNVYNIADFDGGTSVNVTWTITDGDPAAGSVSVNTNTAAGTIALSRQARSYLLPSQSTDDSYYYNPTVYVVDSAGNTAQKSTTYQVDRVPPQLLLVEPADHERLFQFNGLPYSARVAWLSPDTSRTPHAFSLNPSPSGSGYWGGNLYSRAVEPYQVYAMTFAPIFDAAGNPGAAVASRTFQSSPVLSTQYAFSSAVRAYDVASDQDGLFHIAIVYPSGDADNPFAIGTHTLDPKTGGYALLFAGSASDRYAVVTDLQAYAWLTLSGDTPSPRRGLYYKAQRNLCQNGCPLDVQNRMYTSPTLTVTSESLGPLVPTPPLSAQDGNAEIGRFNSSSYVRGSFSAAVNGNVKRVAASSTRWVAATELLGGSLWLSSFRCVAAAGQADVCDTRTAQLNNIDSTGRWVMNPPFDGVGTTDPVTMSLAAAGTCAVLSYPSQANGQRLVYLDDNGSTPGGRTLTLRETAAPTPDFVVNSSKDMLLGIGTTGTSLQLFKNEDCNQWVPLGSPINETLTHARPVMIGNRTGYTAISGGTLVLRAYP